MCGVIGYIGPGISPKDLYFGLKRLEYRGYDSSGLAVLSDGEFHLIRAQGKLDQLEPKLTELPAKVIAGIGHTRWATHGKPSEENAHPHRSGNIMLLHNGIIENYRELKSMLKEHGYEFASETDSEVAAHLIHLEYQRQSSTNFPKQRMREALYRTVAQLQGTFAFGVLCIDTPDVMYSVKQGSSLVIGKGNKENYLASGITAVIEHTNDVLLMEDGEIALITADDVEITTFQGNPVLRNSMKINWDLPMLEKGKFKHYMLKEIHEQPKAVADTVQGRITMAGEIDFSELGMSNLQLENIERIHLVACGTSYYASLIGKYLIEEIAKLSTDVEIASEFRYRNLAENAQTLVIAVSQSGETIDTVHAVKHAKSLGMQSLAVVNVPGSSLAHSSTSECLLHAGPEIGVASTKAFSAQLAVMVLLACAFGQQRGTLSKARSQEIANELFNLPNLINQALDLSDQIKSLAEKLFDCQSVIFIGRGKLWPVALEGALKLKELSYIHAEGYAAGELKHGPIALIDKKMSVVALAPRDRYYEKNLSNIEEVRSRGGKVFAFGEIGDKNLADICDEFIGLPKASELSFPFISAVPLHLLAYWCALLNGNDIDQPRNLAKSVTVE